MSVNPPLSSDALTDVFCVAQNFCVSCSHRKKGWKDKKALLDCAMAKVCEAAVLRERWESLTASSTPAAMVCFRPLADDVTVFSQSGSSPGPEPRPASATARSRARTATRYPTPARRLAGFVKCRDLYRRLMHAYSAMARTTAT